MKNLYTAGALILIVFALSIRSTGYAFSKVETGGREDSGRNLITVMTTMDAPQVCGGINFTSQAQVDAFPATYDCSDIIGNISISGADITNVDSLASLRSISGSLAISYNPRLINLNGLRGITSVTTLIIRANSLLTSLNGLQGLTSLSTVLEVVGNSNLTKLDGLSGLSIFG